MLNMRECVYIGLTRFLGDLNAVSFKSSIAESTDICFCDLDSREVIMSMFIPSNFSKRCPNNFRDFSIF